MGMCLSIKTDSRTITVVEKTVRPADLDARRSWYSLSGRQEPQPHRRKVGDLDDVITELMPQVAYFAGLVQRSEFNDHIF